MEGGSNVWEPWQNLQEGETRIDLKARKQAVPRLILEKKFYSLIFSRRNFRLVVSIGTVAVFFSTSTPFT